MGPDNISSYLLNLPCLLLLTCLRTYNLCNEQTVFPATLKTAKFVPVLKTNDLFDPNNYRHFSLLPLTSKPLERHIQKKRLLHHFESNDLIYQYQHGFCP